MLINIADDLIRLDRAGLLKELLVDKTLSNLKDGAGKKVKRNIVWATNAYIPRGEAYGASMEIRAGLLSKDHFRVVQTRARKAFEEQTERTKRHAEVFTPLFICKKMNDVADEPWTEEILQKKWKKYVDARRLEITCGEGPFLVSRYDAATGEIIPVKERIGILDRKLSVVTRFAADEKEWVRKSFRALQATYGYEFQGDNLLIARVNVLSDWTEWLKEIWQREPSIKEIKKAINIIAWNLWQMDGLTGKIPNTAGFMEEREISLFDPEPEETLLDFQPYCRIYDWINIKKSLEFKKLAERGKGIMKFDFVIGNPPYQDESVGKQEKYTAPIYDKFIDESYKIAPVVELIHPARFLYNAGGTSKKWNQKMLSDVHLKVLYHEQDSSKIFPNTDIQGGVVITSHDINKNYGAIGIYTAYPELNKILKKVKNTNNFKPFESIIKSRGLYRFSPLVYQEHPEEMAKFTDSRIGASSFNRAESLFFENKPSDGYRYVQFLGLLQGKRVYRWFRQDYFKMVDSFNKYKVFVPAANGSGALGEVPSTPLIGQPLIGLPMVGHTETFMSIGSFNKKNEADACYKYVCSKFCRAMLGVLKISQHNSPEKWGYVPLQNFTNKSDINWDQSIHNIDQQLYKKYGLDEDEISFIESHVKEMA